MPYNRYNKRATENWKTGLRKNKIFKFLMKDMKAKVP